MELGHNVTFYDHHYPDININPTNIKASKGISIRTKKIPQINLILSTWVMERKRGTDLLPLSLKRCWLIGSAIMEVVSQFKKPLFKKKKVKILDKEEIVLPVSISEKMTWSSYVHLESWNLLVPKILEIF